MSTIFYRLAWLAVAGALGTVARYAVQVLAVQLWGKQFPWGTLIVNTVGCFLFGLIWTLAQERGTVSPETRAVVLVGFLGAFTTFSSFAFESVLLARESGLAICVANVLAQNVLGAAAVVLAVSLVRSL